MGLKSFRCRAWAADGGYAEDLQKDLGCWTSDPN
jgi:hypothetical protein